MSLFENPIFLTQRRLVHRAGVMAFVLFAGVLGLSLLSGLVAFKTGATDFNFVSIQDAAKMFYGWLLALELLLVVVIGYSRIVGALQADRKAGLWDSNRMTPLAPSQLASGYWFGPPLRELYAGAALMVIGLVIVLLGGLPVTFWLETQCLVLSTTLFFGLLGVLTGLAVERSSGGALMVLALFILMMFSFIEPRMMLTNFVMPLYGLENLFLSTHDFVTDFTQWPQLFGLGIPPIVLTFALQGIIGVFAWRAVLRKTANPGLPLFPRGEALVFYTVLLVVQHGLMWDLWRGHYPLDPMDQRQSPNDEVGMLIVGHIGAMIVGLALLASLAPLLQPVRVEALRTGRVGWRLVFSRSAVLPALGLSAITALVLLVHFIFTLPGSGKIYAVAVVNLLGIFVIFTLLLEYCRLRFGRRAPGFGALGLFILCVLPFILAGVFSFPSLGWLSLLSPGVLALSGDRDIDLNFLLYIVVGHLVVAALLFLLWSNQWRRLLAQLAPGFPVK